MRFIEEILPPKAAGLKIEAEWDMSPVVGDAIPISSKDTAGTSAIVDANTQTLTPAGTVADATGVFFSAATSGAIAELNGTFKVVYPTVDAGDNFAGTATAVKSVGISFVDFVAMSNNPAPGDYGLMFFIQPNGSVAVNSVINGAADIVTGPAITVTANDSLYFRFDKAGNALYYQLNETAEALYANVDLTGFTDLDYELTHAVLFAAATPVFLSGSVTFDMSASNGGRIPLQAGTAPSLPAQVKDNALYRVTVAGEYLSKQTTVGDLVMFTDNQTQMFVFRDFDPSDFVLQSTQDTPLQRLLRNKLLYSTEPLNDPPASLPADWLLGMGVIIGAAPTGAFAGYPLGSIAYWTGDGWSNFNPDPQVSSGSDVDTTGWRGILNGGQNSPEHPHGYVLQRVVGSDWGGTFDGTDQAFTSQPHLVDKTRYNGLYAVGWVIVSDTRHGKNRNNFVDFGLTGVSAINANYDIVYDVSVNGGNISGFFGGFNEDFLPTSVDYHGITARVALINRGGAGVIAYDLAQRFAVNVPAAGGTGFGQALNNVVLLDVMYFKDKESLSQQNPKISYRMVGVNKPDLASGTITQAATFAIPMNSNCKLTGAADVDLFTIQLPQVPTEDGSCMVYFQRAVNTLSVTPSSGTTIVNTPTTAKAGQVFVFMLSGNEWIVHEGKTVPDPIIPTVNIAWGSQSPVANTIYYANSGVDITITMKPAGTNPSLEDLPIGSSFWIWKKDSASGNVALEAIANYVVDSRMQGGNIVPLSASRNGQMIEVIRLTSDSYATKVTNAGQMEMETFTGDVNTLEETNTYFCTAAATNLPAADEYYLEVFRKGQDMAIAGPNNTLVVQRATNLTTGAVSLRRYSRDGVEGSASWKAWFTTSADV